MNYPIGCIAISRCHLSSSLRTVHCYPSTQHGYCQLGEDYDLDHHGLHHAYLLVVGHVHLADPAWDGETGQLLSADVS